MWNVGPGSLHRQASERQPVIHFGSVQPDGALCLRLPTVLGEGMLGAWSLAGGLANPPVSKRSRYALEWIFSQMPKITQALRSFAPEKWGEVDRFVPCGPRNASFMGIRSACLRASRTTSIMRLPFSARRSLWCRVFIDEAELDERSLLRRTLGNWSRYLQNCIWSSTVPRRSCISHMDRPPRDVATPSVVSSPKLMRSRGPAR